MPAHVTAWSVFEWFAAVLQLDLLSMLKEKHTLESEPTDFASIERQSFQSSRHFLPAPSLASPFWHDLSTRFHNGVLLAQIASTLQGESVQGVQLQPKNAAAKKANWTAALNTLRRQPHPAEGRMAASGKSPSHHTGNGMITFDLLYGLNDVAGQQGVHPAVLWNLLATIYGEYSPVHRVRDWAMEPTESIDDAAKAIGFEADKENQRSTFGDSAAFRPVPSPAHLKLRARSASRDRKEKSEEKSHPTPATPSSQHATPAGFSRQTPKPALHSVASPSLVLQARERSASPSTVASEILSEKEYGFGSSAPLDEESYARLQHLVHQVSSTSLAIDAAARSRPIIFQPKVHLHRTLGHETLQESFATGGRLKQARPDREGLYYGPQIDATQHPAEQASATEALLTDEQWQENWPPVLQIDAQQEKCVREWLASELGLYVLPSQEFADSPLDDPFRNGTLLCDLATKFRERFFDSSVGRSIITLQSKRKPTILMSVLENVIRGLSGIREALRYRQQQRASTSHSSALPPHPISSSSPESFATQLQSLSPRMETVVDGMVKGNSEVMWGVMWHLYTEWSVGERRQSRLSAYSAAPQHNAGWTDRERMLLSWIQQLGVGVAIGVVDDSGPNALTAAAELEEAKAADLAASLRGSRRSAGGSSRGRELSPSASPASGAILPIHSQVGILQFLNLFRKGVLLCDLVCATASQASSDPSAKIANVVRDPRTWKICRQNIEKAMHLLSARPRMSLHLFRRRTVQTLDAIADGDRAVTMALINDIYTCYHGDVPHHHEKDCMGRSEQKRAQEEKSQSHLQAQQPRASAFSRRMPSPSPRGRPQTDQQPVQVLTQPQPQPQSQPQLDRTLPRPNSKKMRPNHSPSSNTRLSPASATSLSSMQVLQPQERQVLDVTMPKLVHEALMLHHWLRSLVDTRLIPAQLLTAAEQRAIPSAHHAQLGIEAPQSSFPTEDDRKSNPFSSGILLCDLVGRLTHTRLRGVVTQPTPQQKKSTASLRAIAVHNNELALEALRKIQRMTLTYLYRETANAIVQNECAVLRALLGDIRTAFPASAHRLVALRKTADGRSYE